MKALRETLDILVPHFRDPEGLEKSLQSIAEQTWQGAMRVIVVDDGTPEQEYILVEQVCEKFRILAKADILLLRNPQNLGRPKTRNILLRNTKSTYIAWLDAGDIWYPDKLYIQFEHLRRLQYSGHDIDKILVSCAYDWHQIGHSKPRRIQQKVNGDQFHHLLVGNKLRAYLWTLLGTAKAFRIAGQFDEALPRLQDLDYFINFVRGGGRIEVPPNRVALCCYFKSDIGRNAKEIHACYDLILRKHRPDIIRYTPAFMSELRYKMNRLAARFSLSNGDYLQATGYLMQAVWTAPRHSARVIYNVLSSKRK